MAFSLDGVRYSPGQGGLARLTALFPSTPAANSTQWAGIGDVSDGYFFGFDGTTFNVMRRQGGSPEFQTLTVTTGSSNAENITITLDGDADATVAVTNTADTTLTANEIAAHDYSAVGTGWSAHAMGPTVTFISFDAATHAGAYTLAGTSAVGAFAQAKGGSVPTETAVAQTSWNHDVMDGTGASTMTLDKTKGNVYQIRYQWLGFGRISFYIEDDTGVGGKFILVHEIHYANSATTPSVNNPTLPLCVSAANAANTSNMVVNSGSWGGFIEGRNANLGISNAVTFETASVPTSETPLFTIHNHSIFQSVFHRVQVVPKLLSAAIEAVAGKSAILRIRLGATLTGASFAAHDADTSVVFVDSSATAVSGGSLVFASSVTTGGNLLLDLTDYLDILRPPEFLTVTLEGQTVSVDAITGLTWKELF